MNNIKMFLMVIMFCGLSACTINQAKEVTGITADTALVNAKVTKLKDEYRDYSNNELALRQLDILQMDFYNLSQGNLNLVKVLQLRNEAVRLYDIFLKEAIDNKNKFSESQWTELVILNQDLVDLNLRYSSYTLDTSNSEVLKNTEEMLQVISTTTQLLKIVALL